MGDEGRTGLDEGGAKGAGEGNMCSEIVRDGDAASEFVVRCPGDESRTVRVKFWIDFLLRIDFRGAFDAVVFRALEAVLREAFAALCFRTGFSRADTLLRPERLGFVEMLFFQRNGIGYRQVVRFFQLPLRLEVVQLTDSMRKGMISNPLISIFLSMKVVVVRTAPYI